MVLGTKNTLAVAERGKSDVGGIRGYGEMRQSDIFGVGIQVKYWAKFESTR